MHLAKSSNLGSALGTLKMDPHSVHTTSFRALEPLMIIFFTLLALLRFVIDQLYCKIRHIVAITAAAV